MKRRTMKSVMEQEVTPGAEEIARVESPEEPITSRPDGYYWHTPDRKQEFGPFETYELAYADMHAGDPDDLEPGESLLEAESEIGIADWIDPETGDPAEGMARPHLDVD